MNYLEALNQRYSVKKFEKGHQVPADVLQNILEAGKLSASSLGLQPYRIIVAESEEIKEELIPAFYNPTQISTCSHLLIIVSNNEIEEEYVGNYFSHISETREIPLENLQQFRESINKHMTTLTKEDVMSWAQKQSYIVLGNLMFAAALEKIDTCPMEGYRQEKIDEILNLNPEKEKTAVTLAPGYRSAEDEFQNLKKVRKPNDRLFKFL